MVENVQTPIATPTSNERSLANLVSPWKPGQCPNPHGRSGKKWKAKQAIRDYLRREIDPNTTEGDLIIKAMGEAAKDRDVKAAEFFFGRVHPKPADRPTVSITNVTIESNTYIDRVRANTLAQLKELTDANGNGHTS